MLQNIWSRRIRRSAIAAFSAFTLLAGTVVHADEILVDDNSGGVSSGSTGSIDTGEASRTTGSIDAGNSSDSGSSDSAFLIEDTGDDVQYEAGVPMDTLQDAMDAGDTETLEKIASLGALTGSPNADASSGLGGGGAYRGGSSTGQDIDPDEYYNLEELKLDEGDADEVEVEPLNESPGRLIAANADRLQEYLDSMTQVESPTGSEGELTVAAYIETKLGEMGYTVQEQAFHEGVLNEDGIDAPGVNILAERGANSQNNRKKDIFLVVTHYDSKRSPEEGDPFANDKSGAAVLIETARILAEVVTDTDICFVFLSGEEDGGYGAQNFIASLSEDNRSRITGVLTVERVGYNPETPYVLKTYTGEANPLGDIVQQLGIANDANIALTNETDTTDDEDGTWVGVGESSDGYIDEATAAEIAAAQAEDGGASSDDETIYLDADEYIDDGSVDMALDEDETEAPDVPMPSAWSYLKDSSPTLTNFANQSFTTVAVSQYMPDLDAASYEETKALGLADTTVDAVNQAQAIVAENADASTAAAAPQDAAAQTNADGSAATIQLEDSNLTGSADDTLSLEQDTTLQGTDAAAPDGASIEEPAPDSAAADVPDAISAEEESSVDIPVIDAVLVADTTNVIAASLAKIMDPAS